MKKTHSANIGGTVFQIEEDAYEHLQAYLQSIQTHFQTYPDIADIVSDIEGRIAEQLLLRDPAPQIVRMADVERVIATMGRIEQFDEPPSEPASAAPPRARKLFRDPDQKIIAGVAAGLAAYLGVPPLLVRLCLIGLTFLFGTAVIAYLLLWALVPAASSTTDRLQMRGRPLTLASIDQDVRDGIASIPPATRNIATRGVMAAGSLIHLVVTTLVRVLRVTVGTLVVGAAALGVLGLSVLLVVALVNAGAPPLHRDVAAFLDTFGSWQNAFKVFVYLLAVIPLVMLITVALRLFWNASRINSRGLAGLMGVWVLSLLATAAIWSRSYPELRRYWEDYPAIAEAQRGVERFSKVVESTSPLSEQQAKALLETLAAEQKRRIEEERAPTYFYGEYRDDLVVEQERLTAREQSNLRIIESARHYLDPQQLALLQDSMAQYVAWAQAALQSQRERRDESNW